MRYPHPNLDDLTEATFTSDHTRPVAELACSLAGLDARGADLLRHQTNAVYRLATAPVIVKVARPDSRATPTVLSAVRWLAAHGVPTVEPLADIDQPLDVAGCAVTFWHYLHQPRPLRADELAEPLSALHHAPRTDLVLPALAPFPAIRRAIERSSILDAHEKAALRQRCLGLAESATGLRYEQQPTVIHSDPQHRNALWHPARQRVVLCDWDDIAIGQPEWDLVTIEVHCRRFGYGADEYDAFVRRYGLDIRDWDGYPILRDIRELRMITTNARKSAPGSPQAQEVRRRVGEFAEGTSGRQWVIL